MVKRTEKSGAGCYRLVGSKDKMVEDSEDCEDILDKPDRSEEETEGEYVIVEDAEKYQIIPVVEQDYKVFNNLY